MGGNIRQVRKQSQFLTLGIHYTHGSSERNGHQTRLLHSPSLVAIGLSTGYRTWVFGINIECDCLNRNVLWAKVTDENFHLYKLLTFPLHNPSSRKFTCSCACAREKNYHQINRHPPSCLHNQAVTKPIFSFPNNKNIGYLFNNTFIFDRCHRSLGAAASVKNKLKSIHHVIHLSNMNVIQFIMWFIIL